MSTTLPEVNVGDIVKIADKRFTVLPAPMLCLGCSLFNDQSRCFASPDCAAKDRSDGENVMYLEEK